MSDFNLADGARPEERLPSYAAAVKNVKWYHCFDFGNGLYTHNRQNADQYRGKADAVFRFGVEGKSVIDIGAWDGYFSFEAERRGAARVLATDHFCWSGPGVGTKDGFDLAKSILGSKIEELDIDIPDIAPGRLGMFDVVLFLGVLYHSRDPLGFLKMVYSMTREYAVIESALDLETLDRPALSFVRGVGAPWPNVPLSNDPTNFYGPNSKAVVAMLETVGFKRIAWEVWPAEIPRGFFWAFR